ncbi:Gfo/Idh/MocA family protein [Actinophytocola sp.]|uniref:Gfo/Idh/MocA family protein n=1 Tax=Actinophytocola sp. TaxID=1872138 RepID=UPI003D6BF327
MRDDLRIGIVGLGQRSVLADLVHRPGAGSGVTACADPDPTARARAEGRFGSRTHICDSYLALTDRGLDAVIVTTPDHTHEDIIVDFLEAGIAVFAEKPLATSTEACDHILDVARRTRTRLYVGHNMRHLPVVTTMRELIVQGAIGDVQAVWCRHFVGDGGDYYFHDWHADRSKTTGLLLQKGAHDIDVIHWLSGSVSRSVTALGGLMVYGGITDRAHRPGQSVQDWYDRENNWPPRSLRGLNPVIDVEDLSMMLMRLENGTFASYQQCHFTPDYWRNYTVIGTEGRLENFGDEVGARVEVWSRRSGYRATGDRSVAVVDTAGGHGGADVRIMSEFLGFVRDGGPTLTSPVAARDAVAAGCAATASLRAGGSPATVRPTPPEVAEWFADGQA